MYDTWIQAATEGKMTAATMINMNAAFDTVDIDILLGKCKLYNFGDGAMKLLESYLRDREQLVSIGGSESDVRKLEAGVPQGSILGPLLYTLYTNDFPEVVHKTGCKEAQVEGASIRFRTMCTTCGSVVCFADDSTYTVIAGEEVMTEKLIIHFEKMAEYLEEQRLSVNQDKTHLLLLTTAQRRRHIHNEITVKTEKEIIKYTETEKLLGIELEQNMGFGRHIDNLIGKL